MKRLASLVLLTALSYVTLVAAPVYAVDLFTGCQIKYGTDCSSVNKDTLNYANNSSGVWKVVSFALSLLGGIAVIMIIVGGIRYSTSNGDASRVKAAKDTIMYSVVGLVVALLATAIVALVNEYF